MNIETLKTFFLWCAILNWALLLLSVVFCSCAGNWIYGLHSKWFPITREQFNVVLYSGMMMYKILVLLLYFVPFIALVIMG